MVMVLHQATVTLVLGPTLSVAIIAGHMCYQLIPHNNIH